MEREGSEVIRILLVDDVEKIRESLRAILATSPHFEIVGEACDGEEAVLAVAQLKPSVVVMDINMPRLNGIEATAWIRRTYPHVVVVGVSAIATEDTCQLMKAAGATTVISKDAVEQLQRVIRESVGQGAKSTGKQSKGINSYIGVMCNPRLR
jgi:DNA-binding NarL/FixJ family response regulator